jgi:phospholipid/cholesterol/gamma-HCH transport system ATP-binding protein
MPQDKAPELKLHDVKLGYPGHVVIERLTMEIPANQITVILGGSGSGKSTVLRHILGLSEPMSGRITINGKEIASLSQKGFERQRKHMGVLFQDGALLGSLTLGENVALPLQEHTDLDDDLIEDVVRIKLRLVGLDDYVTYYPRQLSGGMRKRAGLARAMVLDPALLLCDEPSAGLDPITAADLDQLILELKATFDMTIVVVTHDLESLFAIADHVIVLRDGRSIYQGGLEGLKVCPDPYIKSFLNRQPTVRFVNGRRQHT